MFLAGRQTSDSCWCQSLDAQQVSDFRLLFFLFLPIANEFAHSFPSKNSYGFGLIISHERTPIDEAVSRGKMDIIDAMNEAAAQVELTGTRVS